VCSGARSEFASAQPGSKSHSVYEVADNVRGVAVPADLVDADDVGMAELRRGTRLAQKVLRLLRAQPITLGHFHRNRAIEFAVARFPNRAKIPGPYLLDQLKTAKHVP